jgi:F-type H+-transporting ATPase subunit delta
MQPNREAYRPAAEQLEALAAQRPAGTGGGGSRAGGGRRADGAPRAELIRVGDELFALGRLLAREPRLRRALADPARAGGQRADLLRSVLAGKVGDDVLELGATLVAGRWPAAGDLRDAVERLGVDALLAAADQAGELAEVEDELFRFGQVVDGAPELAAVLGDPITPVEQRASLIDDLLGTGTPEEGGAGSGAGAPGAKVGPVTARLIRHALSGFGGRGFATSLSRLVELAAARRERRVAYVTTAVPLSEQEETRLGARLAGMYGREVSLKITVDPRIIGGLSVLVGSDLYDGTVVRRLNEVRTALTK